MEVISLTEGKINRTYIAGKDVITKQSSFDEIKNIEIARKALTNKTILLKNDVYMFHLPKIYDYKDGCIFMEFLQGDNLELDLRNSTNIKMPLKIPMIYFNICMKIRYYGKILRRATSLLTDSGIL